MEITSEMWKSDEIQDAIAKIKDMFDFFKYHRSKGDYVYNICKDLLDRYNRGERTFELYKQIMELC